jgi:hypothetical protein
MEVVFTVCYTVTSVLTGLVFEYGVLSFIPVSGSCYLLSGHCSEFYII